MVSVTKIFHFEMAHAIHGYPGPCSKIHGHSYVLHVSVTSVKQQDEYIPSNGILFDFKELKQIVNEFILNDLDHQLVLSELYINNNTAASQQENLLVFKAEPTAENLLVFIRKRLKTALPVQIKLCRLILYETADSYAEWNNSGV